MIPSGVHAANGFSFDYMVQGQEITLTPCIDETQYDEYKWTFRNTDDHRFSTRWIPIDDLDDHVFHSMYNTTYLVTLSVKDTSGGSHQTSEYVSIGSNHTLTSVTESGDPVDSFDFFNGLPEPVIGFFSGLHPVLNIIFVCVIIGLGVWFVIWDDRVIVFKRMRKK